MLIKIVRCEILVDHGTVSYIDAGIKKTNKLRNGKDQKLPKLPSKSNEAGINFLVHVIRPKYGGCEFRYRRGRHEAGRYMHLQGRSLFVSRLWVELVRMKEQHVGITIMNNIRIYKTYPESMLPAKVPLEATQQALLYLEREFPKTT